MRRMFNKFKIFLYIFTPRNVLKLTIPLIFFSIIYFFITKDYFTPINYFKDIAENSIEDKLAFDSYAHVQEQTKKLERLLEKVYPYYFLGPYEKNAIMTLHQEFSAISKDIFEYKDYMTTNQMIEVNEITANFYASITSLYYLCDPLGQGFIILSILISFVWLGILP